MAGFSEVPVEEFKEAEASKPGPSSQVYDRPIEELELSMRAYNCLKRAGITKVGEILDRWSKGQTNELLAIRNFGQKSLAELLGKMREKGYLPAEDVDSARLDGLTDGSAEDDEETA